MTTYTWPGWGVEDFELRIKGNAMQYPNPTSKEVAVIDMMGEYWAGSLSLPAGTDEAEGAAREVFFDKLLGRVHRIGVWNLKRPVPRGTARGTLTLGAAAAQNTDTLVIAGCVNRNLLRYSGFELDSNSDGLCDGLGLYSSGSVGAVSYSRAALESSYAQRIAASTLGTASGDRAGFSFSTALPVSGGLVYSVAAKINSTIGTSQAIEVTFYSAASAYLGSLYSSWVSDGATNRRSMSGAAPDGAATAYLYIYMHSATVAGPQLFADLAQFEQATVPTAYAGAPTLLQGDMLGAGSQLFRIQSDAIASDAGTVVVTVGPRVRVALASGAAVTWDKPTVPVLVMADDVATLWRSARFDGISRLPFVEA